jgi:pimeloyl-ACP methyl ester carboxylesterase
MAVVAAIAVITAVGCTSDDDASPFDQLTATSNEPATTPTTEDRSGTSAPEPTEPQDEALEWEDCGASLECATLTVPLDYDDPDGPTTELAVIRRPAEDPDNRIGTIAVNPGEPGGSGVELLDSGFTLGGELDERFDLVSWDPRGVGGSQRVTCGGEVLDDWLHTDPSPDDDAETDDLHQAAEVLADQCEAVDGDFLAHVSTADAAEDLDRLRAALGEEQIGYLGLSYGTFIGQVYLEAHPDRLRAMVLDGVMDPADPLASLADAQAGGFEDAFDRMAEWCDSSGECATDDPQGVYDELAERVESAPLELVDGEFGPAELQVGTEAALYSPVYWSTLADGLVEALDGDARTLQSFVDGYYGSSSFTAYAAVVCLDFAPPDSEGFDDLADTMADAHPRFGVGLAYELLPCGYWSVPPEREPASIESPAGAPPVLSIATTHDPATPIAEAIDVAGRLDGELLRYEGDGHVAIHEDPCVDGWIEEYFVDLTLPPADTTC